MIELETERLRLRRQTPADAPFILALMNDPDWIRNIGDKGIRSVEQAEAHIRNVTIASYERHGYGFLLAERKEDGAPIGICGLAKRDFMDDADVGYALMPAYRGQGYAFEAAAGVLAYARSALGMTRVAAITAPDNETSARLLRKLGMREEGLIAFGETGEPVRLFAIALERDDA